MVELEDDIAMQDQSQHEPPTAAELAAHAKLPLEYDYSRVKRWTRKNDVTLPGLYDLVIIPINIETSHWFLAVINFRCVI